MAGRKTPFAFNCTLLFIVLLWLVCEVIECKEEAVRRHDVHRIILKGKTRNRTKKPPRPSSHAHDYHHEPPLRDYYEDHFDHFHDQQGEYSDHRIRYHTRPTDYPKDFDNYYGHVQETDNYNNDRPKDRNRYNTAAHQFDNYNAPYNKDFPNHNVDNRYHQSNNFDQYNNRHKYKIMDIEEFNAFQDDFKNNFRDNYSNKFRGGFEEYERYKQLMEQYNSRNEENFKKKVEKSKQQPVPFVDETFSTLETQNYPVAWKPPKINSFKGDWNPIAHLESSDQTKLKEFSHKSKNIEEIIELTTSKSLSLPSVIVETNFTAGSTTKHRTPNFSFNPSQEAAFYPNHKYTNNSTVTHSYQIKHRNKGTKNNSYQVYEESGDVTVSPILASFQNLAPAASPSYSNVWNPPGQEASKVPVHTSFGTRTKSRRTKRPATVFE